MNFGYRARAIDDMYTGGHRLYLFRELADGRAETLLEDGSWQVFDPMAVPPQNAGILLPTGGWNAIREHATPPGPTPGEVARLEEALTVERARVDRTLAAFLTSDGKVQEADRG